MKNEFIKCPYCNALHEPSGCPDLFYTNDTNTSEINEQVVLQTELQTLGYNIVTCGNCGEVFIHKI